MFVFFFPPHAIWHLAKYKFQTVCTGTTLFMLLNCNCSKIWFVQNLQFSLISRWLSPAICCPTIMPVFQVGSRKMTFFWSFVTFSFSFLKVIFALITAIIAWGHHLPKGQRYVGGFIFDDLNWGDVVRLYVTRMSKNVASKKEAMRVSNKEII